MATYLNPKNLIAFHGDPAIKAKYIERVKAHSVADEIIQGTYWENGKGCAVGCSIHSDNHYAYETELGIPASIAFIEDGIFEALPNDLAKSFPMRFLEAIQPGADLSLVTSRVMFDILADPDNGLLFLPWLTNDAMQAIEKVADLYNRRLSGEEPTINEWAYARASAYAAGAAAFARAAYGAGAHAAANTIRQSERLLHHLANAPIVEKA